MATKEPTTNSEQNSGFDFGNPESNHEIEIAYSWRYVDSLILTENGVERSHDQDGYPAEDGNDDVRCTCGKEFESIEEGRTHLKRVGAATLPPLDVPREIVWTDDQTDIQNGLVTVVLDQFNFLGKVVVGADYLVATAREAYHPPKRFQFEAWEPLVDGRLTWGDGSPLFSHQRLRRALGVLTPGADYRPERYTIYFRGEEPLYIEGAGTGVVMAKLQNGDF